MNHERRSVFLGALSLIFLWTTASIAEEAAVQPQIASQPVVPVVAKKKKRKPIKKVTTLQSKSVPVAAANVGGAVSASGPVAAKSGRSWFKDLKERLNRSQARQNQIVAVAAVRGDESSDATPLYWKGKNGEPSTVITPEIGRFQEGVDAALSDDDAGAREKFNYFVTTYPQSPLKADADEALRRLGDGK